MQPHGDALLHGPADDAAQHVVAALVAGQHAVHDQEGHAARVVGHGAQRPRRRLAGAVAHAGEPLAGGDEVVEGVRLEDGRSRPA